MSNNYPDDIANYNNDPRSPLYDGPEEEPEEEPEIDLCEGCSCTVECCRARGTE